MPTELLEKISQSEQPSSPEWIATDVAFAEIVQGIEAGFQTLSADNKERLGAAHSIEKRLGPSDGQNGFGTEGVS